MKPQRSLRERFINSAAAVLTGSAYEQGLRLVGNLIMTRLLYPEAFGIFLIINLLFLGLAMLSDAGVRDLLIARQKEISKTELDTTWTIMFIRGGILTLIAILLAYPMSIWYDSEIMAPLIIISALSHVIQGASSPYPIIYEKKIEFTKVMIWRAGSQTLAMILLLGWLALVPTIWALAFHYIISAVLVTAGSYLLFGEYRPRFHLDLKIAGEYYRFGRWVFIATMLAFVAHRGDALLVSTIIPAGILGVFSIALALSQAVSMLTGTVGAQLLRPLFSELREGDVVTFEPQLRKVRYAILSLCFPMTIAISCFGRDIINLLYDDRYSEAGWMLEMLGVGTVFVVIRELIQPVTLAFGDSYRHMWMVVALCTGLGVCMVVGWMTYGFVGLVAGISAAKAVDYIIVRAAVMKYQVRGYLTDALYVILALACIAATWFYRGVSF